MGIRVSPENIKALSRTRVPSRYPRRERARSWIQGKLLVAFLVEVLLRTGDAFFPWGYPLREGPAPEPLPVA